MISQLLPSILMSQKVMTSLAVSEHVSKYRVSACCYSYLLNQKAHIYKNSENSFYFFLVPLVPITTQGKNLNFQVWNC